MALPRHFLIKVAGGKTMAMPSVGFGTWAAGDSGWCKAAVLTALKLGYRHLDCAWKYGVDEEVGAAIRESGVPRSEIFVTTKFWPHFAAPENVELSLDQSLKLMGLEYVDLLLAHWPVAFKPISREALEHADTGKMASWAEKGISMREGTDSPGSFVPTWKAMQGLVSSGKTRAVGVSNFSVSELKEILPHAEEIPISCNQVEVHPWLPQNELIGFSRGHDILTTCYSPFAGQKADRATLLKDPTVKKLAEQCKMDVGQLLQSWAVQRGTVPLGKSQTEARIKSNLAVRRLSPEVMAALDSLEVPNGKGRTNDYSAVWGVNLYTN
ncbi:hypothetical protein A1O7_08900 [Cladophialophora yegresii CBS 114405]|uniref:D-xylose reductase [NAD(P)H] n=1 Tax=Cladophialophora yegresii CBS 114405 TaxID=1182544 RepID=W9WBQ5_9EURO|nr:uncharacterized protein A1O7_08900 [Cladophialophora yegresii CBS 114405]EXJ55969.1 hypothetical protein A1O7_08900 [Cladophialophora yegresii CBS 114405]